MRYEYGFTLLEMLVVLVVLALLATAAPGLLSSDGAHLQAASRDMAATLRTLRAEALRRGIPTGLIPLEGLYRIEPIGETRSLPPGVIMHLQDTAPNLLGLQNDRIDFFTDGSSTGGTITLQLQRRSIALTVSWLTGQVQTGE